MNELQQVQLNILKEFIRVCEKHHLTYFLVGGTCLGAVRHKGFIPWDDDIDVGLPREDYDKFIELQDEFKGTGYFIQTYKTDPKYIYNYAKLRDSNTTYIENYHKTIQINHGVWVDIFPIDGMSYKDEDPKKFAKKVKRTWFNVFLEYPWSMRRKFSKRTFFLDLGCNFVALFGWIMNCFHYRNKHMDKVVTKIKYKDAYLVGNFFGTNAKREAMPREIFMEGTKGEFEGIEVNLPKDYDKYLTLLFHDYMKLPPEDKQVGHHYNSGYSLTQGYKDYIKEHRM